MKKKIVLLVALAVVVVSVICIICLYPKDASKPDLSTTKADGGDISPDSSTTNNSGDPNPPQDYMDGHSQILKNILLDEYYEKLIHRVHTSESLRSWAFQPHPYAFYEDQGIDLTPLKNGQSEAYTMSYVLYEEPNSLYMYTRILLDNSYYQNYLLKYEITDVEYNDYYLMHNGYGEYDYYIQSVFMNNEIAKSRDPEIISSSKVSKKAQEYLTESFQKTKLVTTKNCDIFIMDVEPKTGRFVVYVVPRLPNRDEMHIDSNVATVNCLGALVYNGDIYYAPSSLQGITTQGSQKFNANVFLTQSPGLGAVSLRNYENEENR